MRRILKSVAAGCASVAFMLCSPDISAARSRLVQSVDIQIPAPPTPVTIAGKQRLAYELHITNFSSANLALMRVEARDADRGARLAELTGADLARNIGRPGISGAAQDPTVIAGGMRAIVFLWLTLDEKEQLPKALDHTVELDVIRASGRDHAVVHAERLRVSEGPIPVLSPPLRGGPWVALYDPQLTRGHRSSLYAVDGRARIPARFAIDWVRLHEDGGPAPADESQVSNWYGYGAEVLAVADAVVAEAVDDMPGPDTIGGSQGAMPLEAASGNYVVLDLGGGRHAFYEHLKHGSVRVRAGDHVKSGQVIAQLGNTGSSSSGPHLHFHIADAPASLAAEGLPYVFRSFEVVGAFEQIGDFATGARWRDPRPGEGGRRTMELPDANVVLMFDEASAPGSN